MKRVMHSLGEVVRTGQDALSLRAREKLVFELKLFFEGRLSELLNLQRVSAPLFVDGQSGIQDNLGGREQPVSFKAKALGGKRFEVVQSLAKWKRLALKQYQFAIGEGLVTDMRALRPDEEKLTPIHSLYVDQWDWEKVISREERHLGTLKQTVKLIYQAIYETHLEVSRVMRQPLFLPAEITFVHAEELLVKYPTLSSKERERMATKEKGAIFIIGIGGALNHGEAHDVRSPDYDDWSTPTSDTTKGLNGDILVWNPILEDALELSSMGIRVDEEALRHQLQLSQCEERAKLPWHQMLLDGLLPLTIGGGIGQSRLCMWLLQRPHIGEVQVSMWQSDVSKDLDLLSAMV